MAAPPPSRPEPACQLDADVVPDATPASARPRPAHPPKVGPPRSLGIALAIYLVLSLVFAATAPRQLWRTHTECNHYALLADSWLRGRLDLGGAPPGYAHGNDFALHDGKHYVSFPPFPALLLLPLVAVAGNPSQVRDGLLFLGLAGIGPALLFLVLERLRASGRSRHSERAHVGLSLLLGLGTVYWFTSLQGTVWFAAHVVAVALLCAFLWLSIDAAHPWLAGLTLGLAFASRPPLLLALPFFVYELARVSAATTASEEGLRGLARGLCSRRAALGAVAFALPLAGLLALLAWHNHARFGDPLEFGHSLLQIRWRGRIEQWGLFSYHYLGRNLAVVLTSLPFHSAERGWQVNAHGLALWVTTPAFLWALWPRRTRADFWAVAACAAAVALPSLLYQNTGWVQFGYRFSNDFAPLLVLLVALGSRRLRAAFWLAVGLGIIVNGFGALTFNRSEHARYYFIDPTQRILHQPD